MSFLTTLTEIISQPKSTPFATASTVLVMSVILWIIFETINRFSVKVDEIAIAVLVAVLGCILLVMVATGVWAGYMISLALIVTGGLMFTVYSMKKVMLK